MFHFLGICDVTGVTLWWTRCYHSCLEKNYCQQILRCNLIINQFQHLIYCICIIFSYIEGFKILQMIITVVYSSDTIFFRLFSSLKWSDLGSGSNHAKLKNLMLHTENITVQISMIHISGFILKYLFLKTLWCDVSHKKNWKSELHLYAKDGGLFDLLVFCGRSS